MPRDVPFYTLFRGYAYFQMYYSRRQQRLTLSGLHNIVVSLILIVDVKRFTKKGKAMGIANQTETERNQLREYIRKRAIRVNTNSNGVRPLIINK